MRLTPEQMDSIGLQFAQALKLKRDRDYKDRWETQWGTKTNTGLYLMLRDMIQRIEEGETVLK